MAAMSVVLVDMLGGRDKVQTRPSDATRMRPTAFLHRLLGENATGELPNWDILHMSHR